MCQKALEAFAAPSSSCIDDDDDVEKGTTTTKKIQNTSSYDTAETEQSWELEWKECPICMEEFKADEIVSWSPDDQTSCLHFFHHECIKGTIETDEQNITDWCASWKSMSLTFCDL